jgi:hypothetical protein
MNKLILDLAEQAKNSIPKDSLGVTEWIETYNHKFAELLVRKCANIADTAEPYRAGDLILQHFELVSYD